MMFEFDKAALGVKNWDDVAQKMSQLTKFTKELNETEEARKLENFDEMISMITFLGERFADKWWHQMKPWKK